jgi:hypothetical protein
VGSVRVVVVGPVVNGCTARMIQGEEKNMRQDSSMEKERSRTRRRREGRVEGTVGAERATKRISDRCR